MFKPFFLLFFFFLLVGCSSWQDHYSRSKITVFPLAEKFCSDFGYRFHSVELVNSSWVSHCYSESPLRFVDKKVSEVG
jgi:hypothetical protein